MLSKTITNMCVLTMLTSANAFGTLQESRDKSLLSAAKVDDRELVTSLIGLRASVDIRDEDRLTPLHWAAARGYRDVARLLIEGGASLTEKDQDGLIPLHKAIATSKADLIRMLTTDTTVNIADHKGETALHKAVFSSTTFVVPQALIDAGANANAQDGDGFTPLHLAVVYGKCAIVQSLLGTGRISVDIKTTKSAIRGDVYWLGQSTALHMAAEKGFTEIARALLGAGAQSDARDMRERTPLIVAAWYGHVAFAELLLKKEYGVNIEDKDFAGCTAFNRAMFCGNVDVGRILIKAGANTSINIEDKDFEGYTVFNRAMFCGNVDLGRILIEAGANINARTNCILCNTPLHNAARNGHYEAVQLLLQEKVYLNVQNNHNQTPLCLAKRKGYSGIADLLRSYGARDDACECNECKGNCIIT